MFFPVHSYNPSPSGLELKTKQEKNIFFLKVALQKASITTKFNQPRLSLLVHRSLPNSQTQFWLWIMKLIHFTFYHSSHLTTPLNLWIWINNNLWPRPRQVLRINNSMRIVLILFNHFVVIGSESDKILSMSSKYGQCFWLFLSLLLSCSQRNNGCWSVVWWIWIGHL